MTPWLMSAVALLSDAAHHLRHRIADVSLMHGWLPSAVNAIAVVLLVFTVGWRSRRWWWARLPLALAFGAALVAIPYCYLTATGLSGEPPPAALWMWLMLGGLGFGAAVMGWRGTRWRRRVSALSAAVLSLLSAALVANAWVGYVPTVYSAWNQVTAGPLPHQADAATVAAMQRTRVRPANGVIVPVEISGSVSNFRHRGELVYLPPAWFASNPPPPLPVVMMIGAEINTPADWVRAGGAAHAADVFAAAHGGAAPILVFVDSGGAFGVDTECVNGTRGNAADHLTREVVPFMISNFGASADSAHWGVAGFSTGGTCALDLTAMHPELFSTFVDIAGDIGPNAGTKQQTINALFGGSAAQWAAFDPATVMVRHGPYRGVSGWFAIAPSSNREANRGGQDVAARTLCLLGRSQGIDCAVVAEPGNHDWLFATAAFEAALPWLAGQVGTPGAPQLRFPASTAQAGPGPTIQAAGPAG